MTTTDVVVCGSGVAGLAAACALGRLGMDVLLLDKARRPAPVAKGEVLQPGSLGLLSSWGALERLEDRGAVRLDRLVARTAEGAELATMDFGELDGAWTWMLAHDYTAILEALDDSLPPTVERRRGVLVGDLLRAEDGRVRGVRVTDATGEHDVHARLVVAADGMSSRLRRSAGIAVTPLAYGHRLVSFAPEARPEVPHEVSAHVTERGLVMIYPLPHGRTRVYVQVGPDELRSADAGHMQRWCRDLIGRVPALHPLADALIDGLGRRQLLPVWRYQAPALTRPGLTMMGEAAHGVHPLTAQGMNTSVGDAQTLADRLAAVDVGDAGALDRTLAVYERERLDRTRDIEAMSHRAARMMTSTSRVGRVLGRRLLRGTGRSARVRYLTTYNMSGLGLRPLGTTDRLAQLGVLPDRRTGRPAAPRGR